MSLYMIIENEFSTSNSLILHVNVVLDVKPFSHVGSSMIRYSPFRTSVVNAGLKSRSKSVETFGVLGFRE